MEKKLQRVFLIALLLLRFQNSFSQGETYNWYFGNTAGINFPNGGAPVAVTNGSMSHVHANATISDANGNLLFYTNGINVWNQNHVLMPNGFGLGSNPNSIQTIIIKRPGSNILYYIFTINITTDELRYSVVDMSLNAGLGDVTIKNTLLDDPISTKCTAVKHCNGTDIWLITHGQGNNQYKAFLITAAGVSVTPVISALGSVNVSPRGTLKASCLGRKIAHCQLDGVSFLDLADFNASTGVVSNVINLQASMAGQYGLEFSPNETRLYVTRSIPFSDMLWQYNLCAGSPAAIISSSIAIATNPGTNLNGLQLGPDGKIYVAQNSEQFIGVINNPNTLGLGCNYVMNGPSLAGKVCYYGFPNFVQSYLKPKPAPFTSTLICLNGSFTSPTVLTNYCTNTGNAITSYGWNFGDPGSGPANVSSLANPTHAFSSAGTYTVRLVLNNNCGSDTLKQTVTVVTPSLSVTGATICPGTNTTLTVSGGANYTWTPGPITGSIVAITPTANTVYTVQSNSGGCVASATTSAIMKSLPSLTVTANTPLCVGQNLNLFCSTAPTYTWTGPLGFNSNLQSPNVNSVTLANTGTYSVSITGTNNCVNSASINVLVNPIPVVVVNNPTVCVGQNINLTSNGGINYLWTGPLGYNSAQQNPIINNATLGMAGQYSVLVTAASGCATTAIANVSVLNAPSPTITANSPCVGGTLQLNGTGGISYTWNGPNSFTSSVQNPNINNVSLAASGNYSLIVAVGSCTAQTNLNVIVNGLPTVTVQSNSPICENQSINLIGSAAQSYTWNGPSGFNSNLQSPNIVNASVANTGIYSLTVMNTNSCVNSTTLNVAVNAQPTVLVNNPTLCVGQAINLTSNGGNSYSWLGPLGFSSNQQNPIITNASLGMSGQYTVTVVSANGCSNTAISNVNISNAPTPTINFNTVCVGGTLQLNTNTNQTYSWAGPNNFTSTVQNPSLSNVGIVASGAYSLVISAISGCTSQAIANVTINPLPVVNFTATNISCFGLTDGMIQANASLGNGPYNYQWSTTPIQTGTLANSLSNGIYSCTVTDAVGCVNTGTAQIIEPSQINLSINSNTTMACAGSFINLNGNVTGGTGPINYSWTPGPNTANYLVTENVSGNNSWTYAYILSVSDQNGCTKIDSIKLTYVPNPTLSATSKTICVDQLNTGSQSIPLEVSGASSYTWLPTNQTGGVINVSVLASPLSYTILGESNGCISQTTAVIVVKQKPAITAYANKVSGCVPLCINLNSISSASITSYIWIINNSSYSTSNVVNNYCFTEAGQHEIALTVEDVNGCVNNITPINVTVFPKPHADFIFAPVKPIAGVDKVTFTDASHGTPIQEWNWYFMNQVNYTSQIQHPDFMYENAGTYPVALVVKSDKGCLDTLIKVISVIESFALYVPNAFTPNGDGLNDIFKAKGIDFVDFQMTIYDRWGELLFTTKDFNEGWNGKYRNIDCKDDVYVWKINVSDETGKRREQTGKVTLLK